MSRPDDIPQDVWNDADGIVETVSLKFHWHDQQEIVARAILNERERCAQRAEGFHQTRDWVPGSFYEKLRREVADVIRKGDS